MKTSGIIAACLTAGALLALPAGAEEENPGRAAYLRYCSACHGAEGKGDGVVSSVLQPKATDLTQLAKAHGGSYPVLTVFESIDGRRSIAAHGDSGMPVWGEVLSKDTALTQAQPAQVRGKVQLIATHVGTLQTQ